MSESDEGSGTECFTEDRPGTAAAGSDWTPDEQASLDQALVLYPVDQYPTALERTILVAALVPTRSAREVALRISWIAARSNVKDTKRRPSMPPAPLPRAPNLQGVSESPLKLGLRSASRASTARMTASAAPRPSIVHPTPGEQPCPMMISIPPPLSAPLLPSLSSSCLFQSSSPPTNSNSSDDACLNSIAAASHLLGGGSGSADPAPATTAAGPSLSPEPPQLLSVQSLLEQNYAILNTFKANMQQCRVAENTELLVSLRDNLVACVGHMGSMGAPASTMPPIPVKLNLELAGKFLPPKLPGGMPPFPFPPGIGPSPPMLMPPGMGMPPHGMMPMPMMGGPMQPHGMMPPFPMSMSPPPLMAMPTAADAAGRQSPAVPPRSFPGGVGNILVAAMGFANPMSPMVTCPSGMLPLNGLQAPVMQPRSLRPRGSGLMGPADFKQEQ